MSIERALRGIAGFFVGASVVLAVFHSPLWLAFTAFVAANLLQSAVTDWCPMMWILSTLGLEGSDAQSFAGHRGRLDA